jgi:hypothetical protein
VKVKSVVGAKVRGWKALSQSRMLLANRFRNCASWMEKTKIKESSLTADMSRKLKNGHSAGSRLTGHSRDNARLRAMVKQQKIAMQWEPLRWAYF